MVVVILAALPVNAGGLVVPVIVVILVLVQIRPVELVVTQLMVYLVAFPVAVAVVAADPLIAAADTAIPADIAANSLTSIIATGAATRLAYIVLVALVVVQSVTD